MSLRLDRDTAFRLLVLLVAAGVLGWLLHDRFWEPWHAERLRAGADAELAESAARFSDTVWSLDPEDHLRPPVPDRENIAHWAKAGAAAVVDDGAFGQLLGAVADPRGDAEVDAAELAPGLEWNAPALDLLRRMDGLNASSYGLAYSRLAEMEVPEPEKLDRAGALLHLDALDALAAGDESRLRRDLGALDALALSLRRESVWVLQGSAGVVERLLLRTVRRALLDGVDPQALRPFLYDDQETPCRRLQRTIAFEAAYGLLPRPRDGQRLHQLARSLSDEWEREHFAARYSHHAAVLLDETAHRVGVVCSSDQAYWNLVPALGGHGRRYPAVTMQHRIGQAPVVYAEYFFRVATDRRLGRVALAVREAGLATGSYPGDLSAIPEAASDRYLGEGMELRPGDHPVDGGGVEIALRPGGADERHRRWTPRPWRLPPVGPSPPSGVPISPPSTPSRWRAWPTRIP